MTRALSLPSVVLAIVALTACSSEGAAEHSAEANINGGTRDTHHRAIVGLERDGEGRTFCTASVIAPSVLVTAAHCFVDGGEHTFRALLADDVQSATPTDWVAVRDVKVNPRYDDDRLERGGDIAVVLLERALEIEPLVVNRTPLDASFIGASARLVGYGLTGFSDEPGTVRGVRHQTVAPVQNVDDNVVIIGDAAHRINSGDSGGPALATIDGAERIVGITSYSAPQCEPGDCFTRIDRWADTFLATFLARP